MQLNVSEAKSRFSEIIAAAEHGEEVIIAKRGVPVARLVPFFAPRPIRLGLLEGAIRKDSIPAFF
jgi:prevent-host-death family protein